MDNVEKICVAAIVVIVLVAALAGYAVGQNNVQKEAILLGHAHYAYKSDGAPVFKWNECIQMH